jgi:hypothetical protein
MKKLLKRTIAVAACYCAILLPTTATAQTDLDAIMMEKSAFCVGPMYSYTSWKNYWEGTLKRENLNLGRVSTQMIGLMGAYGITRKLNALFSVPYVSTKASAGTMHGMKGIQDLSLFLKWKPYQKRMGDGRLSVYTIGGISIPLSNYTPDYLPLSIGLYSSTASARLMVDYEQRGLYVTGSATYVARKNFKIDRSSYYTTQLHLTNEIEMPDGASYNVRLGFRNQRVVAEAILNQWRTLGGFDITRNNMPFPSNKMNATTVGVNFKYVLPKIPQLSIVVGGSNTIAGRNVGQATNVYGSFFYVLDFSPREKSSDKPSKTN